MEFEYEASILVPKLGIIRSLFHKSSFFVPSQILVPIGDCKIHVQGHTRTIKLKSAFHSDHIKENNVKSIRKKVANNVFFYLYMKNKFCSFEIIEKENKGKLILTIVPGKPCSKLNHRNISERHFDRLRLVHF